MRKHKRLRIKFAMTAPEIPSWFDRPKQPDIPQRQQNETAESYKERSEKWNEELQIKRLIKWRWFYAAEMLREGLKTFTI